MNTDERVRYDELKATGDPFCEWCLASVSADGWIEIVINDPIDPTSWMCSWGHAAKYCAEIAEEL